MRNFIVSSAGRFAGLIQAIGVGFDPEVLSLPGGSAIAAFLWLYTSAMMTLKRMTLKRVAAHKHAVIESVSPPACVGCLGRH